MKPVPLLICRRSTLDRLVSTVEVPIRFTVLWNQYTWFSYVNWKTNTWKLGQDSSYLGDLVEQRGRAEQERAPGSFDPGPLCRFHRVVAEERLGCQAIEATGRREADHARDESRARWPQCRTVAAESRQKPMKECKIKNIGERERERYAKECGKHDVPFAHAKHASIHFARSSMTRSIANCMIHMLSLFAND